MSSLYGCFLPLLPEPADILDAACGSGRDARAFATLGHEGTAFDASPALVALAEHHVGQTVHCLRFQDISWQDAFDGIWACASLPYVPAAKLPVVMRRLRRALKPGGVLYASFKSTAAASASTTAGVSAIWGFWPKLPNMFSSPNLTVWAKNP
ncbi:MAG: class I SAM-dependent methyltransferase [Thiohalocapsa sp.]